ncbi:ABC transporter substrate-binding protein [Streptomyces sp. URMC 129]|uniref:ABC transporter substrate-binding protein n=1 Tax=Streptomyces sp. URMC 129 TaxID=3423407 RepID=UPI003F193FBB
MNIPHGLRHTPAVAVLTAGVLALSLAACSDKTEAGDAGAGQDGVATDIGVTDDTITLGALTDMTGPYATLGTSVTQAQQLWVKQTNEAGGICDRRIRLEVRDHAYDAEQAVSAYTELTPRVLAYPQFVGSPYVAAVKDRIDAQDHLLVLPQGWSASLLGSPYIQMVGTTYDIETINMIAYLTDQHGLSEGDTIGHIFFEGDYGENALEGSRYAAERLGLDIVEQRVTPADQDMTAQVTALAREDVDAIVLSAGPRQAASVVGVSAASGLDIPIIGNGPSFAPQLLETDAAPALQTSYHVASTVLPMGADEGSIPELAEAYAAEYPDATLDNGVVTGYRTISAVGSAIEAACESGDLTRQGVADAMATMTAEDDGFGSVHDFSDPANPSTLESYILRPDESTPGGLVVEQDAVVSELAASFPREE